MNCGEIVRLAPLYHSAELDAACAAEFNAHLRLCAACAGELAQQREIDSRLRDALAGEEPGCGALKAAVSRRIAADTRTRNLRRLLSAAAGLVVIVAAWYAVRAAAAPRLLADAARDHRREVVDRQPKKWRSEAAELATLAQRQGIRTGAIATLAGFRLDRGRLCRLDGRVFLHLVYSDGSREVSVYLRQQDNGPAAEATAVSLAGEQLVSFTPAGLTALCVAEEKSVALSVAHSAANAL